MNVAFCFQDFQTKQHDFVKAANSRLAHKKVVWLRKAFFKQIKDDRILFYYFACAHHVNRMCDTHPDVCIRKCVTDG